ncbi:hypothetical protein F4677DRAFT_440140 [Hypoxylon crocopeplum]|nr:hypothetical protein F4677DRAFT_440140 [Hypoxylon crocopeplum]
MASPQGQDSHPLFKIPNELLREVIHYLPLSALNNWSRACRGFKTKIRPILYNIDMGNDEQYRKYSINRCGCRNSLVWACTHGLEGTLRLALDAGADINRPFDGSSNVPIELISMPPLHCALLYRQEHIVRCLIENGADVRTLYGGNGYYLSTMHYATSVSMVRRLHHAGWTTTAFGKHEFKDSVMLKMMQRSVSLDIIEATLDIGVSVDDNGYGQSMLYACYWHRLDVLRLLIRRGFLFQTGWRRRVSGLVSASIGDRNFTFPGTYGQLCITLALEGATYLINGFNCSTMRELVEFLLERYLETGRREYRSEALWLILSTGPRVPVEVRSLLLWDFPAAQAQQAQHLESTIWKQTSISLAVDKARALLDSLSFGGSFSWITVQPFIKRLTGHGSRYFDIVCSYPNQFVNPEVTEQDEALTVEVLELLLKNGALRSTPQNQINLGLEQCAGMAAKERVKLLIRHGALFRFEHVSAAGRLSGISRQIKMTLELRRKIIEARGEVVGDLRASLGLLPVARNQPAT